MGSLSCLPSPLNTGDLNSRVCLSRADGPEIPTMQFQPFSCCLPLLFGVPLSMDMSAGVSQGLQGNLYACQGFSSVNPSFLGCRPPQFLASPGAPNSNLRDLSPIRSPLSVPALSPMHRKHQGVSQGKSRQVWFSSFKFHTPSSLCFIHFPEFLNNCFSLFCLESIIVPTGALIQCSTIGSYSTINGSQNPEYILYQLPVAGNLQETKFTLKIPKTCYQPH